MRYYKCEKRLEYRKLTKKTIYTLHWQSDKKTIAEDRRQAQTITWHPCSILAFWQRQEFGEELLLCSSSSLPCAHLVQGEEAYVLSKDIRWNFNAKFLNLSHQILSFWEEKSMTIYEKNWIVEENFAYVRFSKLWQLDAKKNGYTKVYTIFLRKVHFDANQTVPKGKPPHAHSCFITTKISHLCLLIKIISIVWKPTRTPLFFHHS